MVMSSTSASMSDTPDFELLIQSSCDVLWDRHAGKQDQVVEVDGVVITREEAGFRVEMHGPSGETFSMSPDTARTISRSQQMFAAGVLQTICHHSEVADDIYGLRHADDPRYRSTNT